jgi:AMP deaminase
MEQCKKLSMVIVDGVAEIPGFDLPKIPSRKDFRHDLVELWKIVKSPEVKSLAMKRLEGLSTRFQCHLLEHASHEREEQVQCKGDIYSVMKVDNHIHLAAAFPPTLLLKFIKHKLQSEPEQEVAPGKTLKGLIIEALGAHATSDDPAVLAKMIDVDTLRVCAGDHFYHRFDNFNDAYSPLGCASLRNVFMKSSNHMKGRYFAELTKETIHSFEKNHTYAEMRLSIYGKNCGEWDDLAGWVKANQLHESPMTERNLWMVQIPRVFKVFCKAGVVKNFADLITNIFQPLFEVALDPSTHPELAEVLPSFVGIDCVDDESIADPLIARRSQVYGDSTPAGSTDDALTPDKWNVSENPPYSYYSFFIYANLRRFNDLCDRLGRPWHLSFRPHAGEAGEVHHLATAFLVTSRINHGINLYHSPVLQLLYFMTQIGVSVAPISNNALFLRIKDNPFPLFFRRGLNVSLSTDDPLMFHATNQPLMEEYTAARLVFGLSNVDLCEIAANSVRQSGFPHDRKVAALGNGCALKQPYAWSPQLCNVPNMRLRYRRQQLAQELSFLKNGPPKVPEIPELDKDPYWRTYN